MKNQIENLTLKYYDESIYDDRPLKTPCGQFPDIKIGSIACQQCSAFVTMNSEWFAREGHPRPYVICANREVWRINRKDIL